MNAYVRDGVVVREEPTGDLAQREAPIPADRCVNVSVETAATPAPA
jgi:hypothetical protein